MQLIDYTPEWFGPVTRLFYESVHRSGGAAYSPEELEAWAPREMDFSSWETSLVRQRCVLALDDRGELCGFGDIDAEGGYLDRLYVRSDCQRQGVAGAICDRLEQLALDTGSRTIRVDASPGRVPLQQGVVVHHRVHFPAVDGVGVCKFLGIQEYAVNIRRHAVLEGGGAHYRAPPFSSSAGA